MELAQVMEQFCALAGIPSAEAARYKTLAEGCMARLNARLKPGANLHENAAALCGAAAGMLYYQYALLSTAEAKSFQLGDVAISGGGVDAGHARAIRDELMAGVARLCNSQAAFLLQVNG